MYHPFKVIIFFTLFIFASGQEKNQLDVLNKIIHLGFNKSEVMDIAWNLSDGIGPKLTNSKNIKKAQQWILDKLNSWDLKNVEREEWGTFGKEWDTKKYSAELISPYYERLIAYPKAWSKSTEGVIKGTPILIDIKSESDLDKYEGKLKGKIVMLKIRKTIDLRDIPESSRMTDEELMAMKDMMDFSGSSYPEFLKPYQNQIRNLMNDQRKLLRKLDTLYINEGVAAIISMDRRNGRHGTVFSSGSRAYDLKNADGLAEFEMSIEHYQRLVELIDRKKKPVVALEMINEINSDNTNGHNIIAEIPGKGNLKNEIVILGAHYDSWHFSTGATDNTAGTSVMMEATRILNEILKNDKRKNRRTIRLALWSGEEQGLRGSRGYVKKHVADSKKVDGKKEFTFKKDYEKISAYYNLDTGTGKIRGLWIEGNAAVKPIFSEYLKPFHPYGAKTITMDPTGGTDHQAFDAVGVPSFTFIQDELEYWTRTHHSSADNFYRLQEDDLKQASTIVASFVYHTAIRKKRIPRKAFSKN